MPLAAAAVVPVPLLDVAVDATLLSKLLPEISAKFGLIEQPEAAVDLNNGAQINQLKDKAVDFAGLVVTRSIAKKTFQGFGLSGTSLSTIYGGDAAKKFPVILHYFRIIVHCIIYVYCESCNVPLNLQTSREEMLT